MDLLQLENELSERRQLEQRAREMLQLNGIVDPLLDFDLSPTERFLKGKEYNEKLERQIWNLKTLRF